MQPFVHPPDPTGRPLDLEGQQAPAARGRVLVVEDDPEAALFAVYALMKRGCFEVIDTPDPTVALALAAAEPWDLALIDLDLPVMSGTELIAALRQLVPDLPVILITGHTDEAFSAADGGRPDSVLVKPVSAERLLDAAITLARPPNANGGQSHP
jgi:CheY-like chemotaxis protein